MYLAQGDGAHLHAEAQLKVLLVAHDHLLRTAIPSAFVSADSGPRERSFLAGLPCVTTSTFWCQPAGIRISTLRMPTTRYRGFQTDELEQVIHTLPCKIRHMYPVCILQEASAHVTEGRNLAADLLRLSFTADQGPELHTPEQQYTVTVQ